MLSDGDMSDVVSVIFNNFNIPRIAKKGYNELISGSNTHVFNSHQQTGELFSLNVIKRHSVEVLGSISTFEIISANKAITVNVI
jgi:hypothetical protein